MNRSFFRCPIHKLVYMLAQGWQLGLVVEFCDLGNYGVLVWRDD